MLRVPIIVLLFLATFGNAQSVTYKSFNMQGMGFVTGIIAHPMQSDLIYVRTDVGGIYRYNATGNAWIPLNDNKKTDYGIESFALDPSNTNTIYAAIGNLKVGSIWKSADQGASWSKTGLSVYMEANGKMRHGGERLAVDPFNGQVVYFASVDSGFWKSTNGAAAWSRKAVSSLPKGTHIAKGDGGGQIFTAIDPTSGSSGSACTRIYVGVQGHGVYRSENGGETFSMVAGGPDTTLKPIHCAINAQGRLYVTYSKTYNGGPGAVYSCTPGASLVNITPPSAGSAGFAGIDVIGNTVITYKYNAGPDNPIHFSTNGGSSWVALDFNNGSHSWVGPKNVNEPAYYPSWSGYTISGQVMLDPYHSGRVWLTNGFGVYRTDNIGGAPAQWNAIMENLEELVAQIIKKPPVSASSNIFLGCQDMLGFVINDPTKVPTTRIEKEKLGIMTGMDFCEADPRVIVRIGSGEHEWWENYCAVSRDNGTTWQPFTIPPNFDNGAVAVSATNSNHWLWAPENDYWNPVYLPAYTKDGGTTWTQSSGLPSQFNGVSHMWAANQFICSDRVNGNLFYYYAHYNGQWGGFIYRSEDGGATFTLASSQLPCHSTVKLESVPGKTGHLFASFGDLGSLMVSTNKGSTFAAMPGVDTCTVFGFGAPMNGSAHPTIYIAGVVGKVRSIFRSTDYGVSWQNIGGDIPMDNIKAIEGDRTIPGRIYLAAGGRGFFYGDISSSQQIVNTAPFVNSGTDHTITIETSAQLSAIVTDDGLPAHSLTISWSKVSGPGTVTFTNGSSATTAASFSLSGTYILRCTATDGAISLSDDITVTVNAQANRNPLAVISATAINGAAPFQTVLSAAGSGDPDGDNLSYSWSMGDGQSASGVSVNYTFATAGSYRVRLTVTDCK